MLDRSIDLTIWLLLMMNVGHLPASFSAYKSLSWEYGLTLQQFVSKTFEPRGRLLKERVKLDRLSIAKNLGRIAGIKVTWTDNLADHLRVLDGGTESGYFPPRFLPGGGTT